MKRPKRSESKANTHLNGAQLIQDKCPKMPKCPLQQKFNHARGKSLLHKI